MSKFESFTGDLENFEPEMRAYYMQFTCSICKHHHHEPTEWPCAACEHNGPNEETEAEEW